jgi:hypothetical protein
MAAPAPGRLSVLRLAGTRCIGVVALALLLGGCAAHPPEARQSGAQSCPADWAEFGEAQGRAGHRLGIVELHLEACSNAGVQQARAAFRAGHAEGLAGFCTTAAQYARGRSGEAWRNVCPAEAHNALREAHADGLRVHAEGEALAKQRARLADIEQYARVGAVQPRDRERFGDPPLHEREALRAAERALYREDARLSRRHGAEPLAGGSA